MGAQGRGGDRGGCEVRARAEGGENTRVPAEGEVAVPASGVARTGDAESDARASARLGSAIGSIVR